MKRRTSCHRAVPLAFNIKAIIAATDKALNPNVFKAYAHRADTSKAMPIERDPIYDLYAEVFWSVVRVLEVALYSAA